MRNNSPEKLPQIAQTEIEEALTQLETAFAVIGCVNGSAFTCPVCGESRKGKVVLRPAKRYWKCYVCGVHPDDPRYLNAIDLVKERCSLPFPKAVNLLLGKHEGPIPKAELQAMLANARSDDGFRASAEPWVWELYSSIVHSKHASLSRAQEYYRDRHISPEAVELMRFRYITDPDALRSDLLATYGEDRLIEAGVAVRGEHGLRLLCGWNYPVIEPAIDHRGRVRNLQFRPSVKQREKIRAHKRGEGPYVPTFMSIKGSGPKHLIGVGLHLLAEGPGRVVMVAEGAADAAAGYTLGAAGMYAVPGTNVLPPSGVVAFLAERGHKLVVALDGDDAGRKARGVVADHFRSHGYAAEAAARLGFDVPGLIDPVIETAMAAAGPHRDHIFTTAMAAPVAEREPMARQLLRELYETSCNVREKADMPDGLDVCDILIRKHAIRGCTCQSCTTWRDTHPT